MPRPTTLLTETIATTEVPLPPVAEKTRYSQEKLEKFRMIINKKLKEERELLKTLKDPDNGTSDTDPRSTRNLSDAAVAETGLKERNGAIERSTKFIKNLEAALVRIDNGTYGICRITGKLIPEERLRLVPHATTSVEGKNEEPQVGRTIARSMMSVLNR